MPEVAGRTARLAPETTPILQKNGARREGESETYLWRAIVDPVQARLVERPEDHRDGVHRHYHYKRTQEALVLSARDMAPKKRKRDGKKESKRPLPARLLEELTKFSDTHDMGESWEEMPETQLGKDLK